MRQKTILYLSFSFFVALLLWGLYSLFVYLGVPVHTAVIAPGETAARLSEFCPSGSLSCRGLFTFLPFVFYTLSRLSPLLWYVIFSGVIYSVFVVVSKIVRPNIHAPIRWRPWHVYACFLASLTLIFTVLNFGSVSVNTSTGPRLVPARQIIQPTTDVYRDADSEALANLQRNFSTLQDSGCLADNGPFAGSTRQYLLKTHCVYGAFISRTLSQVFFITLLFFTLLVTGRFVLTLGKFHTEDGLVEFIVSAGIGAGVWIAWLWTLAVFGMLTATVGWASICVALAIGYKHVRYWLVQFVEASTPVSLPWYHVSILLFWLLISYLAFNFLNVVRPFPIGWDDLGSYLNRPRLMVSYGEFIYSMSLFQWEYLTSLGFLLFGYDSTFGATASMQINWMAGLYAIFTIFVFTNHFLGKGRGLLAAILYYFLPMVGHFSFADMKIDNAVFATGSLSVLCMFLYLFPKMEENETWQPNWQWIVLSGVFGSLAFGMKATAIMVIMANVAVLLGVLLHWTAFVGAVAAAVVVYMVKGLVNVHTILERITGSAASVSETAVKMAVFVLGLGIVLGAAYVARKRIPITAKSIAILVAATVIPIIPGIVHNNAMRDWQKIGFELGAPNNITPSFDLGRTRVGEAVAGNIISLPAELAVDMSNEYCQPTGHIEELDRYWGFDKGLSHYLTLPWRSVNNIDSGGYYVTTMPGLLLWPLLLLLPIFWFKQNRWMRWLFASTAFIVLEWVFLANGIPWYGVGMFLGLCVGLETLIVKAPDFPSRMVLSGLITVWILIMLNNRMWQFEMQRNIFEYSMGKVDAETMTERTIPYYDDIADVILQRKALLPTRPYLYRIGTFIPYFIPRNLEVIGTADHQLDNFNCLYQERDPQLTTQRLKALGFNSFVFDTNTATIERDPNGSLHQKVKLFTDYLSNPESGVQVVLNDPSAGIAFILIP